MYIYMYTRIFGRASHGLDSFQTSGPSTQFNLEAQKQMTLKAFECNSIDSACVRETYEGSEVCKHCPRFSNPG